LCKRGRVRNPRACLRRSRDLVAAPKDLFVSFKDPFVSFGDLLVIFNPTNKININNHLLHPIKALGLGGGTLGYLLTCSLD
jgi:hypothetical protein